MTLTPSNDDLLIFFATSKFVVARPVVTVAKPPVFAATVTPNADISAVCFTVSVSNAPT